MKNFNVDELHLAKISVILNNERDENGNSFVKCHPLKVSVVKKIEDNLYSKKPVYIDVLTNEKYYPLLKHGIRGALVYDDNLVPLKNIVKTKETISKNGVNKLLKEVNKLDKDFLFDKKQEDFLM